MKKVELTLGQYERLIELRDYENKSIPAMSITEFVRTRFNAKIHHKACTERYNYYNSLGMSTEYPYSYRGFKYTVTFEHEDERFTWFMLHL